MAVLPQVTEAQVNEYFSIRSSWSGAKTTVTFNGNPQTNIEYSTDKISWTPITETTEIDTYNKTYFRGTNPTGFSKSKTDYVNFVTSGTSQTYYLEGNIMSLVSGSDFATNCSTIPADYCFYSLFTNKADQYSGYHAVYWEAGDLSLPADNLTKYCYASMFERTYIKTPPQLPAQHLAEYCYYKMFYTCISLNMQTSYPAKPIEYILPAEELVPHCYEHMFGVYNNNPTMYQYITMMATSLQDRCGNDIENCLKEMFYFGVALNSASAKNVRYFLQLFFTDWGDVSQNTCPTYNWFGGNYNAAYNYFFYDGNLPWEVSKIAAGKAGVRSQFPTSAYSCETNNCTSFWEPADYGYLTFDCKTNGGTWESGCAYKENLRRVVRSDYKAKTVPAAPVKAGEAFKGWYTQATGGTKVDEATILNQTAAQTYYAQFGEGDDNGGQGGEGGDDNPQDDTDLGNIKMTRGVLDMPTYYSFAILGENEKVTVRLHFSTMLKINTTNYLNNLTYDIANSYIQPAGGEKRQIASASLATVEYLGDSFRAAHLVATVEDTEGNTYNIDIYTNEELNYATFEDVTGYLNANSTGIIETSWRTCHPFSVYGSENNHIQRLITHPAYDNLLYTYYSKQGGSDPCYEVKHIQLQFFPDKTKPGKIPTGVYPINSTLSTGSVLIGSVPSSILTYEQNSRQDGRGSFVQYEIQENDYSYPYRDMWVLRDGYVEVVNVDEKYWVHVHAYTDAHRTNGLECAVIDFTADLDEDGDGNSYTITTADVTLSAQTEGGASLTGAVKAKVSNASSWTDVEFSEGTYKFFTGNKLTLNAAKSGYEFSHWLINGERVEGNGIEYTITDKTAIVAVFTGDGEGGDDPETPIVSQDESVNVYQNVSKTTTKILYNLDLRKGEDGLWYKPTDMGYGIAWADRNVGAASVSATGDYYNWSKTEVGPLAFNKTGYSGSLYVGFTLPAADDVATVKMGKDWHTPTYDEWETLAANATNGSNRLTNPDDESIYINTPPTGYYDYYNGSNQVSPWLNASTSAFYWTNEVLQLNAPIDEYGYLTTTNIGMATNFLNGTMEMTVGYIHLAAPVRAIYTPPFTTYTLTIRVGSYEYRYICQTGQKVTVTAIATEEGSEFVRWDEDGLTDAVRTFTMTGDMTYTAVFTEPETPAAEDANVTVYQSVTKSTMKILYDLSPKQGKDGLWYTPVDLGYGVAWADRNVGAGSPTAVGSYFYWGGTQARTSFSTQYYYAKSTMNSGYVLPSDADAATVNMGATWRMPTDDELVDLKNKTVIGSDNGTFTNADDNTLSVFLPATGIYGGTSQIGFSYDVYDYVLQITYPELRSTNYRFYWSSVLYRVTHNQTGDELYLPWALSNNPMGYQVNVYAYNENQTVTDGDGIPQEYNMDYFGMPVRAMYVPPFEVCTLTVNVEGYQYVYLCQLGQNVTVTAVANEGYEFDRWTEDGLTDAVRTFTVTGNMTYTATFKKAVQDYNIIYKDKGGATFSGVHATGYPTKHTYGTATVLKSATKEGYTFKGWYLDMNCTGTAVTTLGATAYTGDITLYALWEEVTPDEPVDDDELHIILYEDKEEDYYTDFSGKYNGKKAATVTYNRQFAQSKWATLCLPMNVNAAVMTTLKMNGRVYEFKYTNGDEESGLTLYFSQAKTLVAGRGYIVNANAALSKISQFVFPNMVINTETDINSGFNIENLEGHNTQGDVYLVGTLRTGLLVGSATGNRYMGLKDNKIYYPNADEGTRLLAYRGIFRSSVDINSPRVRIVVEDADGEQVSELEVVNGELNETEEVRKYVQDGVLYIERGGRRYTAQGAQVY